jgi:hypothetical protein
MVVTGDRPPCAMGTPERATATLKIGFTPVGMELAKLFFGLHERGTHGPGHSCRVRH